MEITSLSKKDCYWFAQFQKTFAELNSYNSCTCLQMFQDGEFGQDADLYDDVIITQSSSGDVKDSVS